MDSSPSPEKNQAASNTAIPPTGSAGEKKPKSGEEKNKKTSGLSGTHLSIVAVLTKINTKNLGCSNFAHKWPLLIRPMTLDQAL